MKNKIILIIGGTGALGKTLTQRYYKDNETFVKPIYGTNVKTRLWKIK